ncbi:VOC family protein [Curtobacterium sp. Curtsp57]|jgi:catechol 2,3-dioxygenase-like lactoylglutathione lyase family enzyme|uniref:VOC family protein n=1 Tax=Curtobacterium sp. Curtsp57 TaxID=3243047 RepID=UPI0039B3FD70
MQIDHLDHVVLTVEHINSTVAFYERLGFVHVLEDDRHALRFGQSKINLHQHGHSFQPAAEHPRPGSGDLCFIVDDGPEAIRAAIASAGIPIEEGPVERSGALGPMTSVYVRDPDQNLLEFSTYQ